MLKVYAQCDPIACLLASVQKKPEKMVLFKGSCALVLGPDEFPHSLTNIWKFGSCAFTSRGITQYRNSVDQINKYAWISVLCVKAVMESSGNSVDVTSNIQTPKDQHIE
jgi:hypothetical protein